MSRAPRCCVCGRRLTTHHWVCKACKEEHGLADSITGWPAWVRRERQAEENRRDERAVPTVPFDEVSERIGGSTVNLDYLRNARAYARAIAREWPENRYPTEPVRHLRTRSDIDPATGLPVSPYPTEDLNRQYRAANGISTRR